MCPTKNNGADAANVVPAKEITNNRILPPAEKAGKSVMQSGDQHG
jgi:hypothetical protein